MNLQVLITLDPSVEFDILGENGTDLPSDQTAAGQRSVCIPSQDKQTVAVRY